MANKQKTIKDPRTPEELMKMINGSKENEARETQHGTVYDPKLQIEVPPPKVELTVNGFVSKVAQDVFDGTGSRDKADRADAMAMLFCDGPSGEHDEKHVFNTAMKGDKYECQPVSLLDRINTAAKCSGVDDECLYLRQQLWFLLESESASLEGVDKVEDERTPEDEDPNSAVNSLISRFLGKSALGRVRSLAKNAGVSNRAALRAIVFNFLKAQKTL